MEAPGRVFFLGPGGGHKGVHLALIAIMVTVFVVVVTVIQ